MEQLSENIEGYRAKFGDAFRKAGKDLTPETLFKEGRNMRARYQHAHRNPRKQHKYTPEEQSMRYLRRGDPRIIPYPEYGEILQKMDSKAKDTDKEVVNQKWLGYTPQQLDDAEYNSMARNFAEMVGVLQARPKYDRRLLTIPSAKEAFGKYAGNYTYDYEDMDADPNTPPTLVIKNNKTGRIVAAGGYRIPKATSNQTEALMKDQLYMFAAPTAAQRKEMKRNVFLTEKSKYAKMFLKRAKRHQGFKQIVQWLTKKLRSAGISGPSKGRPAYIQLVALRGGAKHPIVNYEVNQICWSSIIRRIAMVFSYYYIFPLLKQDHKKNPYETAGMKALLELAYRDTIESISPAGFEPGKEPKDINEKLFMQYTRECIFDPRVEAAILRQEDVQDEIRAELKEIDTEPDDTVIFSRGFDITLGKILTSIMIFTMNINLPLIRQIIGDIWKEPRLSNSNLLSLAVAGSLSFQFVLDKNIQKVLTDSVQNELYPTVTLTPTNWEKLTGSRVIQYMDAATNYIDPKLLEADQPSSSSSSSSSRAPVLRYEASDALEDNYFGEQTEEDTEEDTEQ